MLNPLIAVYKQQDLNRQWTRDHSENFEIYNIPEIHNASIVCIIIKNSILYTSNM